MRVLGAQDAWSLLAAGGGLAAASPWFTGNLPIAAAGAAAAFAGGAALAWPRFSRMFNPIDEKSIEGFVLPSDEPYGVRDDESYLIGYTKDKNLPVRIPYDYFMRHAAVVGASGGGKTSLGLVLIWQQMARGGGLTFIDAKIDADNLAAVLYMARILGRESDVYVLDISNPERSHTYTPLMNKDPDEVASCLLNIIPSAENNPGADHYRQSVNHALTVIVGAMQAARRLFHFNDLTVLLQSSQAIEELLRPLRPGSPEHMALDVFLEKYRRFDRDAGRVQVDMAKMKDTLGGMAGRLALFAQGKFGQIMNTYQPEVDLYDVVTQNKILYVRLPTMAKETAAINFAKMLLSDFRSAVARVQSLPKHQRPNPPHMLFADEMGSYVMPGIARFFEQARSARIAVIPGFQAFGQLREVSPEFADIILQNTWAKIMFRFGGNDSAEMAAEIIGTQIKAAYSLSQSENKSESAQFIRAAPQSTGGNSGGTGESWRESEEFRVAPSKLAGLAPGECVAMIGPRMFHIRVPMLFTPSAEKVPFNPMHFPRRMPDGFIGLDLEKRYTHYSQSTTSSEEKPPRKDRGKPPANGKDSQTSSLPMDEPGA